MTNKASIEQLENLHAAVASALLTQLQGNPSHQILSVACKFLNDNNITINLKKEESTEEINRELFKIPTLTKKELEYEMVPTTRTV
jgi:hypothetical protein